MIERERERETDDKWQRVITREKGESNILRETK